MGSSQLTEPPVAQSPPPFGYQRGQDEYHHAKGAQLLRATYHQGRIAIKRVPEQR